MTGPTDRSLHQRFFKTLRIWIAVYPSVLLFYLLFGDAVRNLPLPLRMLVSTLTVVTFVMNVGEPLVQVTGRRILQIYHRCVTPRAKGEL